MKKIMSGLLMLLCLLTTNSFAPADENGYYRSTGNAIAVVDNKNFEIRDKDRYRATLVQKTVAMNNGNSAAKQIVGSLIFYGNVLKDDQAKAFEEKLEFEYAFNEGALGEAGNLNVLMHYAHNDYYQLNEDSRFRVSKLEWSADRRYFTLDADFTCLLRKWGYPSESQPTVRLKGKMENITVQVPSWINVKSPIQQALIK